VGLKGGSYVQTSLLRQSSNLTISEGFISVGSGADDFLSRSTPGTGSDLAANFEIGDVEARHFIWLGFVFASVYGKCCR
jgi:hypothetical protein